MMAKLQPGGWTDIADGMQLALEEFRNNRRAMALPLMLWATPDLVVYWASAARTARRRDRRWRRSSPAPDHCPSERTSGSGSPGPTWPPARRSSRWCEGRAAGRPRGSPSNVIRRGRRGARPV